MKLTLVFFLKLFPNEKLNPLSVFYTGVYYYNLLILFILFFPVNIPKLNISTGSFLISGFKLV